MSVLLTCGRCCQWQQEIDAPPDVPFICPVCGGLVPDEAAPAPASETATLPPGGLVAAPGADAARLAGRDWPVVAGYEVLGELGRGGMGVVYQARQIGLNRLVALKMILSGDHAGEAERARFKAEAEAAARLRHPNIVQIFEVGESAGRPFFSLEFVEGGSLAAKLGGTPWRPRPSAGLVMTLARAVHAAHRAGIVHRDLKPANVLLTAEGQPKITDFGLAKKLGDAAGLTQSGAIVGTPSYMAPEQAGGRAGEIGPATDTYALGAILYECLTGRPPFRAATPLDTVLQVINDEPVPPRQLQSKIPRDVETICLKCLRKEPRKRYESAEALADDLERFLDGKPIAARRVGRLERGWRWCRRNPGVAGLTAAVFLSLAAGAAVASWFAVQARDEAQQVRDEAVKVRRHLYDAQMSRIQLAWEENEREAIGPLLDQQRPDQTDGVDLRGPEWHFWLHRKPTPVFIFSSLFWRPSSCDTNGRLAAAVGSGQGTVWDLTTGNVQCTFTTPSPLGVTHVAVSPDGRFLAVGGPFLSRDPKVIMAGKGDCTFRIFDAATGAELHALEGHTNAVSSLAFSPDGQRLASASMDGTARLWDPAAGKQVGVFSWPDDPDHKPTTAGVVALEPGGGRLVWTREGRVVGWDLTTNKQAFSYVSGAPSLAYSPDGKRLASPFGAGIKLWEADTGREAGALTGAGGDVSCVAWSRDGKRLATGHKDGTVKLWDADRGREIFTIQGHTGPVESVAFDADDHRLISSSADGIKVWEISADPSAYVVVPGTTLFAFSPDDKHLATLTADGDVTVWDVAGRREERRLRRKVEPLPPKPAPAKPPPLIAPPAGPAKPGGPAGGMGLPPPPKNPPPAPTTSPQGLTFSPDGSHLVGWSDKGPVHVWDLADGREVLTLHDKTPDKGLGRFRASNTARTARAWFSPPPAWAAGSGGGTRRLGKPGRASR